MMELDLIPETVGDAFGLAGLGLLIGCIVIGLPSLICMFLEWLNSKRGENIEVGI